jgi:membrane-associated phospholipid phosphatase
MMHQKSAAMAALRAGACAASLVAALCSPCTLARADTPAPSAPGPSADVMPPPLRHPGRRLAWDPSFNRMDAPEMVLTGVAAGVALAMNIVPPLKTGWSGPVLFDEPVRSLRLSTLDSRLEARSGSDVGLALMTTYPILVDSIIVAYWYRGSDDVALQMALIDAEAFAIVGALEGTTNFLSGRARPYAADCGTGVPSNTSDCSTDTVHRSFFSGHSAISFTAAALICAHHGALHLFESAADPITCAAGLVAAATIGTLRIVGDAHYFSDVFVGAVVGTTVGLGLPLLHHYKRADTSGAPSAFSLKLVPGLTGAQLLGTF